MILRQLIRRAIKVSRLIRVAEFRRGLRHGVAGTIEHTHLRRYDFRTVFDVGGHLGQFGLFATATWPSARVFSFEPIAASRSVLERIAEWYPRWTPVPFALGETTGPAVAHVSRKSAATSLRPITSRMISFAPGTEAVATEDVWQKRLDDVPDLFMHAERPTLLKIDVQGTELEVLRGATRALEFVDAVYVEASFVELYEGQALADSVIEFLRSRGLRLNGVHNVEFDDRGVCIQADLLLCRDEIASYG